MNQRPQFTVPSTQRPSWKHLRVVQERNPRLPTFLLGRFALYHSLVHLGVSSGHRVLVPAFICRVVPDAISATGADVDYYAVDEKCHLRIDDVVQRIKPNTKAIVALHFAGFLQPLQELRTICDRFGIAMVEDCAHLLPSPQYRQIGDASIFSWRKQLAVHDGANLALKTSSRLNITRERASLLSAVRVAKLTIEQWVGESHLLTNRLTALLKRYTVNRVSKEQSCLLDLHPATLELNKSLLNFPASRISSWLFQHANFERIYSVRRRNYQQLHSLLKDVPGVRPLHDSLPDDVCPWVFPAVCETPDLHKPMRELGLEAVTWAGVRPDIPHDSCFSTARSYYDHLVFLPVHQSLSDEDLEKAAKAVTQSVSWGSFRPSLSH